LSQDLAPSIVTECLLEFIDPVAGFCHYSAGIGVAGAVGAVAACDGGDGPFKGRSSIDIKNAIPNDSTRAQARNTNRKA